jgi:hypothetical protein
VQRRGGESVNPSFPVGLLGLGAILLILALAGEVRVQQVAVGITNKWIRWIAALASVVCIVTAVVLFLQDCRASAATNPTNQSSGNQANTKDSPEDRKGERPIPIPISPDPKKLIEIIKRQQHDYVKDSTGTLDYQCFTDGDYADLIKRKDEIPAKLKGSNEFISIVLAIQAMSPDERQKLLDTGEQTYRRTWSDLGLNPAKDPPDKLRQGQSTAGSKAEQAIAEDIVNLVIDLCKKSPADIRRLYN